MGGEVRREPEDELVEVAYDAGAVRNLGGQRG